MKQLKCPKCGHEFGYDNGYYDRNIERLGHEIADLNRQMANYRLLSLAEQKRRTDWRLRTQKALAEAVGISRQTMNAIEQGDYNPTIKLCRAICKVLGKSLDDLFGEEE